MFDYSNKMIENPIFIYQIEKDFSHPYRINAKENRTLRYKIIYIILSLYI